MNPQLSDSPPNATVGCMVTIDTGWSSLDGLTGKLVQGTGKYAVVKLSSYHWPIQFEWGEVLPK